METHKNTIQTNDLATIVSPSNKIYLVRIQPGVQLQTHRGVVNHDDVIGIPWGSQIFSHQGSVFFVLPPSLSDLIMQIRRNTQIMYPKDIGYALVQLGIAPGQRVLEAGTGSGALTTALAWAVGSEGQVFSYEFREPMQNLARKNIDRLGFQDRVTFWLEDVAAGFKETNLDAIFLDLPNPYDYIPQVKAALKPGGYFGCILPTYNQIERLLPALHNHYFAFVDVCEILLRHYKPVPARLRPTDRMVAHTGFLIFARPIIPAEDGGFFPINQANPSLDEYNNQDEDNGES